MNLRDLLRLAAATSAHRCGDALQAMRLQFRRYQLLNLLAALYRDRDYFEKQVQNGLDGMAYCDKHIARAESEFRRLK